MTQAADPPLRQFARLRTEMAVAAYQLAGDIFPGDPMLSVEFGIVALRCLPDWVRDDAIVPPVAGERSISMRQIARSLGTAPETVRRHIGQLRDRGALIVSDQGVLLATTDENALRVARYLLGVHDLMIRLIEDVTLTCDLHLPVGSATTAGMAEVIERAIEVLLLPVDTFHLVGHQHAFLLWGALTAVAVRGVTYDPVLARRYAVAIPPDELRSSTSLRRLADALGVPYATAWRQIQALHERGLVTRLSSDRWTVLTANLLVDTAQAVGSPPSIFTLRKLRELSLSGLDPACVAQRYQRERPSPPFLG
jgi:biotin operon repressor